MFRMVLPVEQVWIRLLRPPPDKVLCRSSQGPLEYKLTVSHSKELLLMYMDILAFLYNIVVGDKISAIIEEDQHVSIHRLLFKVSENKFTIYFSSL